MRAGTWIIVVVTGAILAACAVDPGYQGRSSPYWIRMLEHPDPQMRVTAATSLGHVLRLQPNSPAVVDALIQALADTSDHVRLAAGFALATEGVRAPNALPGLIDVLGDTAHADTRLHAAQILGQFGPAARPAIPALTAALVDSHAGVRAAAASALAAIGPAARGAVSALTIATRDPDRAVADAARDALASVQGRPRAPPGSSHEP